MTFEDYNEAYRIPRKVTKDYAFSFADWPRMERWLKANGIKWCKTDLNALFGPGLDEVNCLFVQDGGLKQWSSHESIEKLLEHLEAGRVSWALPGVTLLHPSVTRGPDIIKMEF